MNNTYLIENILKNLNSEDLLPISSIKNSKLFRIYLKLSSKIIHLIGEGRNYFNNITLFKSNELDEKNKFKLIENTGSIHFLTNVSIDGYKNIIAGAEDLGIIRLWNLDSSDCKCIATLSGHSKPINCLLNLNPYIRRNILASASSDNTIKLWDLSSSNFECIHTLTEHTNCVNCLQYLKIAGKKNVIGSGSFDNTIRIWDLDSDNFECIAVIKDHYKSIECLTNINIPNKKNILAGGGELARIYLWDFSKTEPMFTDMLFGHHSTINCLLSLNIRNKHFLISGSYTSIIIHNADSDNFALIKIVSDFSASKLLHVIWWKTNVLISMMYNRYIDVWNLDSDKFENLKSIREHHESRIIAFNKLIYIN